MHLTFLKRRYFIIKDQSRISHIRGGFSLKVIPETERGAGGRRLGRNRRRDPSRWQRGTTSPVHIKGYFNWVSDACLILFSILILYNVHNKNTNKLAERGRSINRRTAIQIKHVGHLQITVGDTEDVSASWTLPKRPNEGA